MPTALSSCTTKNVTTVSLLPNILMAPSISAPRPSGIPLTPCLSLCPLGILPHPLPRVLPSPADLTKLPKILSVIGEYLAKLFPVSILPCSDGIPHAHIDFAFSPDVKYVAATSEDGCLRIIDALAEQCVRLYLSLTRLDYPNRLVDCYASYFGALTCVAWSPDGRFVLAGGQDDLITIFSPWEQRVVARCQGHSSFVSAVAFDDLRCDGRTYRFGSVGEDNKLILVSPYHFHSCSRISAALQWDFSSGALHRPKHQVHTLSLFLYIIASLTHSRSQVTHHQRVSISSTISLAFRNLPQYHLVQESTHSPRHHPAPSRNEIAIVQPVLVRL